MDTFFYFTNRYLLVVIGDKLKISLLNSFQLNSK